MMAPSSLSLTVDPGSAFTTTPVALWTFNAATAYAITKQAAIPNNTAGVVSVIRAAAGAQGLE